MSKNKKTNGDIRVMPDSRLDAYRELLPVSRCLSVEMSNGMKAGVIVGQFPLESSFVTRESAVVSEPKCGDKDKGWIQWGDGNQLPNQVVNSAKSSPYVGPGLKFNADVTFANGPRAVYAWLDCSNPANPVRRTIPYEYAGEMLLNAGKSKAWAVWERTNAELREFLDATALDELYLNLCVDFAHFNIAYPEFVLNKGRGKNDENWRHSIKLLRYRRAVCCRMEELDERGRINYIYYSNQWAIEPGASPVGDAARIEAIRAFNAADILSGLRGIAAQNRNTTPNKRTLRAVMPVLYPTVDKFYYPEPAYMSIYRSRMFDYSMRLIRNKAITADNDNMWGHIIYIHENYLRKYYADAGAMTPEQKALADKKLYGEIEKFMKRDENKGKPLMTYTVQTGDGKDAPAIKIEKVEKASATADTKDELEEIASILFFALEMHPSIAGATPGKSGLSGGTETRELFLLKNVRMAPIRKMLLRPLNVVKRFNDWDEHLEWEMPYPVLTTLDANKKGVSEQAE